MSENYGRLKWTSSDTTWLKVVSQTGVRAMLQVSAGAAPASPAFVTVTADGQTAPPARISVAPATIGGQDVLTATYRAGNVPDVVIVNGIRVAGGRCDQGLSAFVARSTLGNLVGPCGGEGAKWGAAVLAEGHSVTFMPPGWTPGRDLLDAGTTQKPPFTLPVVLHVMVGDNSLQPSDLTKLQDDVLKQGQMDIAAANVTLAEARAGIQLAIAGPTPASQGVSVADCIDGDAKTLANDAAGLLNVYYVNTVAGVRGRACDRSNAPGPPRPQDVIYVNWETHSPTTLVHEVGHTLGLTLPGQGHSDMLAGFDAANVMSSGDNDGDPEGRHRLTVGQVFRMNADPASWLNSATDALKHLVRDPAAPRLACQCGAADPAGLCPPLVADVAHRSDAVQTANDWDCFDRLWLRQLPSADDEHPVAIVAGRLWRSPTTCSPDLPGLTENHWQATYIKIANLTRSGKCPSWATVFFPHHRVLYLRLTEPKFVWSQAADELLVDDQMPAPLEIAVRVNYPVGQESAVAQDVKYASKTFGEENRTGINLKFTLSASTTCPTAAPAPNIGVCYVQSGSGEGSLVGPGLIHITIGNHATATLAHFIGRALGLQDLASTDPVFLHNIMQATPPDRGQKLTLGQVFRINVPLPHTPRWPIASCDATPTSCPSLAADATR